jgi:lauroyl/myristoyl acyltransferase
VREQLSYVAFASAWRGVRLLPEPLAYRLFRLAADLAWRRRGPGVQRLEANLARVARPGTDMRRLARDGMRSYLRYWCDAFRLPDWDRDRVVSSVRTEHEERLRDPLAVGRGVVAACMHMGNWDHAGAWAALTGAPVTTVAERLRPERLYERFVAYREGLGIRILPLSGGGGSDTFRALVADARRGVLVPLLADRDLSANGVPVLLAGQEARMPGGPAALALATGASLVPVTIRYEGSEPRHRTVITFHEPVPDPGAGPRSQRVAAMTQAVADVFTRSLAEYPEDWHMLQRVFTADLDPSRPPAGAAVPAAAPAPGA